MWLIVGLGNPGSEYDLTRHNIGFEVIQSCSRHFQIPLKAGKGEYYYGTGSIAGNDVCLVKPVTYMNRSGEAVLDTIERFTIPIDRLLVVVDDFYLPLGTLRLRPKGSDGGHNGLYSIIYHLQTDEFARLRCGIASGSSPVRNDQMSRFVLETFTAEERPVVDTMVEKAHEVCEAVLRNGLENTMKSINTREIT